MAGVEQQERSGPVGVLRRARRPCALPEQCGLLVTGDPGDWRGHPEERLGRAVAEVSARVADLGQDLERNVEQRAQLGTECAGAEVVEHRARGVGWLGDVGRSGGQSGDEPGVDGRERELAALGALAGARHGVEQPCGLRPREVRIEHQPGALTNERFMAGRLQLLAPVRGASVLPHDRAVDRTERVALVDERRLALVRDPDAGHRVRRGVGGLERLRACGERRLPDLVSIVLDPAGMREVLRELAVAAPDDAPVTVDDEPSDTGGPGVDREDARMHDGPSVMAASGTASTGATVE